jgi:glycosyltransferase involved in cell wall biosynthesis
VYRGLSIAVVIPALNEERLVGSTVTTVPKFVDRIIVVDDGSSDSTARRAFTAGDRRLTVLRHSENRGVGAAIATGYQWALHQGADVAAVMAGDGQMKPNELARLIDPIASESADYVKGDRLQHPQVARLMPAGRRLGTQLLTAVTRRILGDSTLRDAQCGYTAISRHALAAIEWKQLWPRYGYPNDLLAHLHLIGLRTAQRPVTPVYGEEQSGMRPLRDGPLLVYVLARAWWRCRIASGKAATGGGPSL